MVDFSDPASPSGSSRFAPSAPPAAGLRPSGDDPYREVLPVDPATCTVLGYRVKANSPAWIGLRWNGNEEVRNRASLLECLLGPDAPFDLHLRVPWEHPVDYVEGEEPDTFYRVRPIARPGKRYKGRKVKSVAIERDDTRSPPWCIVIEYAIPPAPARED